MLIKISGIPMYELTHQMAETAEQLQNLAETPINVGFAFGGHYLMSADLNPINAPHHIVDGIAHLPEHIHSTCQFIINLF